MCLNIGKVCKDDLINSIKSSPPYYGIAFDAATDCRTREQLGIEVRYLLDGSPTNAFVALRHATQTDAKTESDTIREALRELQLEGTVLHMLQLCLLGFHVSCTSCIKHTFYCRGVTVSWPFMYSFQTGTLLMHDAFRRGRQYKLLDFRQYKLLDFLDLSPCVARIFGRLRVGDET